MADNRSGSHTVLVVDDHEDIRELLSMQLRAMGCEVFEAGNGREAVEIAPQVNPDLILMDLSMPELDGYEATRQLRGRLETRDVPVVAVSAFCDSHNRQKALDAGCVECLGKPVDFVTLDEVLRRHLQVH